MIILNILVFLVLLYKILMVKILWHLAHKLGMNLVQTETILITLGEQC